MPIDRSIGCRYSEIGILIVEKFVAATASPSLKTRKIGKNGEVVISAFKAGSTAHYLQVDERTVIVTIDPPERLHALVDQLHLERKSPWAGVAAAVAGRKHVAGTRPLRTFHGVEPEVPISAEAATARATTFPMRRRRSA